MSDGGSKDNPQPSSKRTQRYQQLQPESHRFFTRRNFLRGTAALGAVLLAWGASRLLQTGAPEPANNPTSQRRTSTQTPVESLSPESNAILDKLESISKEIKANPQSFKEKAPSIGNMAIEFFCKELGYKPKDYVGKIDYLWKDEYKERARSDNNCIFNVGVDDTFGYVVQSDSLVINLDASLNNQQYPALALFMVMLHELHHLTSPILDDPRSELPGGKIRGVGLLVPSPENSKPGLVCSVSYRADLDEAIVHDSTQRMAAKLGVGLPSTPEYDLWAERYRIGVIDRFFNGNNRALLQLHQKTRPNEFHTLIGEKLGVFSPEAQREAGERYAFGLITQGIK